MIAVLDSLRSAHNVGSMFRTADAVGITKLVLCGITPTPIDRFGRANARIAKVALGAETHVAWSTCTDTVQAVVSLKQEGWRIVALEQAPGSTSLYAHELSTKMAERTALLVGSEVGGLSPQLLRLADTTLEIPMRGSKESLNVAVAFGIAAYQLLKPQF